MPVPAVGPLSPPDVAELLHEARARTLLLIAPVPEAELMNQHDRLMSPVVWDLGHIAHFEELWLVRNLDGPVEFAEMPGIFNPFENPRSVRGELPLPRLADTLEHMAAARARVLERLEAGSPDAADPELLRDGFVYRMVAQHEYQHGETVLQALQLKGEGTRYRAPRAVLPPAGRPVAADADGMVRFPGGRVVLGTDDRSAAYDNERPAHEVELAPFRIGAWPVTGGEYRRFVEDGGYRDRALWSDEGWRQREEESLEAPRFWERREGGWWTRSMDAWLPVPEDHPVCHVGWHEAEAYARWAGARLPTEPEWEAACRWDPRAGRARAFPWGDEPPTPLHANLDHLAFGTAPVGAYPRNVSPIGCYGMIGDVWEWTASTFLPWPGFRAFPYPEYSEVFFGDEHRVLRGGSWATRPGVARATFRNWDYPIRRQIFAGFRVARDA